MRCLVIDIVIQLITTGPILVFHGFVHAFRSKVKIGD